MTPIDTTVREALERVAWAVRAVAFRSLIRAHALETARRRVLALLAEHEVFCCVNFGDGLGRKAREQYRRQAEAYNRGRWTSVFCPLLTPVPAEPPPNGNAIESYARRVEEAVG